MTGVAARWKPRKDPLAAREAALSGKGAGPELGRRRRGWVVSPPVSLLAASPAAQAAAAGSRAFLSPAGQGALASAPPPP